MEDILVKSKDCLIIKKDDHIFLSDGGRQEIQFYKDKIVGINIDPRVDKKIEAKYSDIETVIYTKKNFFCLMLFNNHRDNINNFKRMFLSIPMSIEEYNILINEIKKIRPDFNNILKRKKAKDFFYKIVLATIGIIFVIFLLNQIAPKGKSEWDRLDDSKKEWYKRNYGNGQYNKIQKSIKDYKN